MAAEDKEVQEGKGIAWLAYFGILFLVPLLAGKDNKFAKFHAKQGMVLCIGLFVIDLVLIILAVLLAWIPFVGGILAVLLWVILVLFNITIGVFAIIGIIQSLSGKYWKMPIFGAFAEKLKF